MSNDLKRRSTSRLLVCERDRELERRSLLDIEQADRAAVGVQHRANDGEAHSGSAAIAPRGKKAVEYLCPVVRGDAFAGVADLHQQQIALPDGGQIERRSARARRVVV